MKKILAIALLLTLSVFVLVGKFAWAKQNDSKQVNKSKKVQVINVQVANAKQMGIPEQVFSIGTLIADKHAKVSSEVDGRIVKIYFTNGQEVTKGEPIVQLDDDKAKASLFSAQAALKLSQTTYQRFLELSKQGGVSQQALDQKQADMETKFAAVKTSEAALAQKQILAPFTGVLEVFNVTQGAYITAGQPLVAIVDKKTLKVEYTVAQKFLAMLKMDQQVSISSDSYPKKVFKGLVSYISPTVDAATGSITLQAKIDNQNELLSPGMFVHIEQVVHEDPNAIVIPEQAIIAGLQGDTVFKVESDKAVEVKVNIGDRRSGYAQVLKGLKVGDSVVIAGQQKLQDGAAINIVPNLPNSNNGDA